MKSTIALTLAASASAGLLDAKHEHIVSMPMHQFKQECGTETHLHFNPDAPAFLQQSNVPGAGVDAFKPFKTVLKDGFLEVDCVKDYMYYRGDKFGDNRHDYKLGPVSDVSIVHYEAHVAKEDQVEMTQKVCFEFCRTVPNMGFFGIVNGRGCYCTPYFTSMESDSSQCDAVCEGEKTLMCGGKSKSSIFAMHMCASTGEDLGTRSGTAGSLKASMDAKVSNAKGLSDDMQNMGAKLQKMYGAVGDSGASGLMQAAKVSAGTLVHKAEDADAVAVKLGALVKSANGLKDFTEPATVTKAERIMEDIDETVAQGEAVTDELDALTDLANPQEVSAGAAKQYSPVMYFVDKEFDHVPATCAGDSVGEPITGLSEDGCASACDANIHSCVGFQYFKDGDKQLCFLFSKFSTGFYYTASGCAAEAKCFAKLSKFEGTTLKPNPSGKCAQCFKELTKADRCPVAV
jgi:uncharacterized protein YoxC